MLFLPCLVLASWVGWFDKELFMLLMLIGDLVGVSLLLLMGLRERFISWKIILSPGPPSNLLKTNALFDPIGVVLPVPSFSVLI
jgi:hypothetical protein